jgi:porin
MPHPRRRCWIRWRGLALVAAVMAGGAPASRADADPFTLQSALKLPDWMLLQVAFSAAPLANPVGGLTQTGAWVQQSSISLQLSRGLNRDPATWTELDHWAVNLDVDHTAGFWEYNTAVGTLFNLQSMAYPPGFWPSEATLERQAGNGWLNAKAGIISVTPEFIAVPILDLYVHASLNNTLNITYQDLPVNPYSSLGGVVTVKPSPDLNVRYGIFDATSTLPVSAALGGQPTLTAGGTGSIQMLQLDYSGPLLGQRSDQSIQLCPQNWSLLRDGARCEQPETVKTQLPKNLLRVGGYYSTDPLTGDGIYGSLTLRSGLPVGLDERVWIGASYSPNRDLDVGPTYVAGGLVVQGLIPRRPQDLLVLGIGRAGLSDEADPNPTNAYEGMAELGYRVLLNENLQLQPNVQWIFNPSGAPGQSVADILAVGLRIDLNF